MASFWVVNSFALYPEQALERYINISKIILMVVVATILINSTDKLFSLVRVIGYSLGFYGLKGGIFAIATGGGMTVWGPENSFLYANNSIGLALGMNIPILLYLLKYERRPLARWLLKAMLLFTYPAIICTYSRGAWIGMVMVTVMCVVKSRKKFIGVGIAGFAVVLFGSVAPLFAPENLVQRYDDLRNYDTEVSAQSRLWNWEFCKRVGLARPLVGAGFDFYTIESYAKFYPEFQERWPGKVWSCHSTWLTVLGEHGIVGFTMWLCLTMCCWMTLSRMRYVTRDAPNKIEIIDFTNMIKSSMIAYFVIGTFIDAAYFDLFYYLVALSSYRMGS